MQSVIETNELSKDYGATRAVDGVSLRVAAGEIYGFLGLNGAGKTTTIRMLLGMIAPTSGVARVLGREIKNGAGPWDRIGSMVEIPYAYPDLSVRENLEIHRRIRGLKVDAVKTVIDALRLNAYADRKARALSMGNAQRLGLARALIHEPELLILDEPSSGLDPEGIVELREGLRTLAKDRGVTVFVSSHLLAEIAKIADRIGIIHGGRLLKEIPAAELHGLVQKRLRIQTRDNLRARERLAQIGLAPIPAADGALELREERALNRPEEINADLVQAGVPPLALYAEEEDLEAYFLRVIHESNSGGDHG